jgi:CRISPR system Cascade subunit CasC
MSRFLQLHLLTAYPPSNLNRDDLNRPKTAQVGGVQRLRISSQCLKRNWRMSELFAQALGENLGTRTKEMGRQVFNDLMAKGVAEDKARAWAAQVAAVFGKPKGDEPLEIEQLAHFSPQEKAALAALVDKLAAEDRPPSETELALLSRPQTAVDIAMFGRMLAASPVFNMEAAVQVAHAFSVQEALVEDDFFTAVDDLNTGEEDVGAGHMGSLEFGAGLFYLYVCIDAKLLKENLGNHGDLAGRTARALVEAAVSVAPSGKQNSFASRAYAHYVMAERGDRQPRSLAAAFIKPVKVRKPGEDDPIAMAIDALTDSRQKMDSVYGDLAEARVEMNALSGKGSLADLLAFVEEACR